MTWLTADFGPDCAGLPVGLVQLSATGVILAPRSTVGVVALGNGLYGIDATLDALAVTVQWDTGTGVFASEDVTGTTDAIATAVWNKTIP